MEKRVLIKEADTIVTMDARRSVFNGYSILIHKNRIERIEKEIPAEPTWEVINAHDMWVFPGLINTHHHLFQILTRCLRQVQKAELFQWLKTLYPIWARLTPEDVYISTMAGLGELLKSGCTTAVDHHYLFPRGQNNLIDYQIEAARQLGIRFHPCRGSMSRGKKDGGLPPDEVVQKEEDIIKDCLRLIREYHDPGEFSMCRIVLAPCSPFSVTPGLMEDTVALAREHGLYCHTHLGETEDENDYCQDMLGMRPLQFAEKVGWLGFDIWFAHGIHFSDEEIDLLAATGTGVAHCPASNQKLASGVAKVPLMLKKNVPLGLAVDGSSSNDASNMLVEMKIAFLMHKLNWGVDSISAEDVLAMATVGGARILGRQDIGSLEAGKAADLFLINKNRLGFAGGAANDPVTALITCVDNMQADVTMVDGKIVVKEGRLLNVNEGEVACKTQKQANRMRGTVP